MSESKTPVRLYGFPLSGHAHRVRLMLSLMKIPFDEVTVDLANKAHKRPDFLALNVFGQVPVIDDGGTVLADSNAILVYLATRYDRERRWLPTDPTAQAHVQRWLSVAAGPLAFGPAAARLTKVFGAPHDDAHRARAEGLFRTMEQHLASRDWLASDHETIADLAMYTYTAHAPEGGISLDEYPRTRAWIARVEALPGFVAMKRASS
ncbi:MAG: glutathione S-transferase [Myxococcales bacterium]|nr:glutathione S-transferase [Myxococcales bacterium]